MSSPIEISHSTPRIPAFDLQIPFRRPRFSLSTLMLGVLAIASLAAFLTVCRPWVRILQFPSCRTSSVYPASISADGQRAAHWSKDGALIVDNLRDRSSRTLLDSKDIPGNSWVTEMQFSLDGSQLLVRHYRGLLLVGVLEDTQVELKLGTEHQKLGIEQTSVALSPDGRRLATAGPDGVVEIWDARTGESLVRTSTYYESDTRPVFFRDLVFSPSGDRLVVLGWGRGQGLILDGCSAKELQRLEGPDEYVDRMRLEKQDEDVIHHKRVYSLTYGHIAYASGGEHIYCWGTPGGHRLEYNWRRETFDAKTGLFLSSEVSDPPTGYSDRHRDRSHSVDGQRRVLDGAVWELRRPDKFWTVTWLPEFWLTIIFLIALRWSMKRDKRLLCSAVRTRPVGSKRNERSG
jgi:WD40 repeat protein